MTRTTIRRAAAAFAALALAAAALAGCGDRQLVLNVDVLSYFNASQTTTRVGPIPAGAPVVEVALVNDESISLLGGLKDQSEVRDLTLTLRTIYTDSTGTGGDTLRVYLSDDATDPRSTTPVLTQIASLTPGSVDTLTSVLDHDPRVAELFRGSEMRATVTHTIRPPASGPDLNARLRVIELSAVVFMKRKP